MAREFARSVTAGDERQVRRLQKQNRVLWAGADFVDLFGDPIPEALQGDYPIDAVDDHLERPLQRKYKSRPNNIRRSWNRVQLYLPELMHADTKPHKVLEMSTAHGGMLEVLRYFGHDVTGNDYVNMVAGDEAGLALYRPANAEGFERETDDYGLPVPQSGTALQDWPYRKIIEAMEIPMALFDAGKTPYPFDDKAFDVLLCFQAIEHYCHPDDWAKILAEFCRITQKTIFVMLNPKMERLPSEPEGYNAAYLRARMALRNFKAHGFICSGCFMHWGEPVGFKLTAQAD